MRAVTLLLALLLATAAAAAAGEESAVGHTSRLPLLPLRVLHLNVWQLLAWPLPRQCKSRLIAAPCSRRRLLTRRGASSPSRRSLPPQTIASCWAAAAPQLLPKPAPRHPQVAAAAPGQALLLAALPLAAARPKPRPLPSLPPRAKAARPLKRRPPHLRRAWLAPSALTRCRAGRAWPAHW